MNSKVIIGAIIVIVLVAAVCAVALAGDDDDDTKEKSTSDSEQTSDTGRITANWREDVGHTLTTSSGLTSTADTGYEYVVVSYTLTNGTSDVIDLNPLVFVWTLWADNVSYDCLLGTTVMYLDGYSSSTVATGGTATQRMVYQIPEGATLTNLSASYVGISDISSLMDRDTSISISAPAGLS